jgi:membrane protease YdiL (CAAX protease family)
MPDPTAPVIIATFCLALGLFAVTAIARKLLGKKTVTEAVNAFSPPEEESPVPSPLAPGPPSLDEASPYQTPLTASPPPLPIPTGGVPIGFYRPLDLLGMGFIFIVFFGLVVASVTAPAKEQSLGPAELISSIGFQFIIAGIVTAFVITRVRPIEWLGLRWPGWRWVFLIAPGTVLSIWILFGGLQMAGYMRWIESLGVEVVQDTVKILQISNDPRVIGLMIFAAVIAAPLCEEIVFRGYLYSCGKRFVGPWVAGICSALIFAAAHGSLMALLPLFVFGCVLAFLYQKTGSLWAPMTVHFCFNGATVLIQLAARHYEIPLDKIP